jgi:hypothetical protein
VSVPSNSNNAPLSGSTIYSSEPVPLISPPTNGETPSLNVHLTFPPSRSTACRAPSIVEIMTKGSKSWSTSGLGTLASGSCPFGDCGRAGSETTAGYGSGAGDGVADKSSKQGSSSNSRWAIIWYGKYMVTAI